MAPPLESCPCSKCSGTLVSHRMVLHAVANHHDINLNQPIQTFNEWIAAAPERLDRETEGSREDDHDGMNEDEDGVIREQRLDRTDELLDVCRDC